MNQGKDPTDYTSRYSRGIPITRAAAEISGSSEFPELHGIVQFRQTPRGVLVRAEIRHLPTEDHSGNGIFGLHIHKGNTCGSKENDPFADAGGHYNPSGAPHPFHAGDLPPLFGNHGYAWMEVLTDRFTLGDILGRTVIIHRQPDDFMTQPSGNSGMRIGCGIIRA